MEEKDREKLRLQDEIFMLRKQTSALTDDLSVRERELGIFGQHRAVVFFTSSFLLLRPKIYCVELQRRRNADLCEQTCSLQKCVHERNATQKELEMEIKALLASRVDTVTQVEKTAEAMSCQVFAFYRSDRKASFLRSIIIILHACILKRLSLL